jgi:23S rRNA (pseudouridine1915-N3)-methyltransferase
MEPDTKEVRRRKSQVKVELLAAGTKPPGWINEGFSEFQKRLPRESELILKQWPTAKRRKQDSIVRLQKEEEDNLLKLIHPGTFVVALDRRGKIWSTQELALKMKDWLQSQSRVQIMIGGPDGLSSNCLARANLVWSLSELTFPHYLVRVLVAEQIYRAWSFLSNHPYHK